MKKAFMLIAIIVSLVLATLLLVLVMALNSSQQGYGRGTLRGKATISSFCPVERADADCFVPPEAYESRKILVYLELIGGFALYDELSIRSDGSYSAVLPTGTYLVKLKSANSMDSSLGLPAEVIIRNNEFTNLDISIDAGAK